MTSITTIRTIKNISTAASSNQTHFKSITLNVEAEGEGSETIEVTTYSDVDFRIRCGVDYYLADIENIDSYGIKVSTNDKEVNYDTTATSWGSDEDYLFVTLSLGDVLTKMDRSSVEFTVAAYVVVDGIEYVSEATKTYSVVDLVVAYYNGSNADVKAAVAPLYELFVEKDLA